MKFNMFIYTYFWWRDYRNVKPSVAWYNAMQWCKGHPSRMMEDVPKPIRVKK